LFPRVDPEDRGDAPPATAAVSPARS
jgi:hypothetical protein